jgi:ParB-like chromosome segregation protein Spo0J
MSVDLVIEPELQAMIPALSKDEVALLTHQIVAQGCLQPLCVWKTEDDRRILLDGHNRYRICVENQKSFQTVNLKLDSREHAKLWILEHQAGRRNLTDDQRAVVWNEIREQRSAMEVAARLQAARNAKAAPGPISAKTADKERPKRDTRADVAKESKLPESKLRKIQQLKKTNPQLYEQVRTGAVTLRQAKPTPQPKQKYLHNRYSEPDFFARIGRMLASTLVNHPLLDELLEIQKKDFTPEAEQGFRRLIKNLDDVSERAHAYANGLNKIMRAYGKAKAA